MFRVGDICSVTTNTLPLDSSDGIRLYDRMFVPTTDGKQKLYTLSLEIKRKGNKHYERLRINPGLPERAVALGTEFSRWEEVDLTNPILEKEGSALMSQYIKKVTPDGFERVGNTAIVEDRRINR